MFVFHEETTDPSVAFSAARLCRLCPSAVVNCPPTKRREPSVAIVSTAPSVAPAQVRSAAPVLALNTAMLAAGWVTPAASMTAVKEPPTYTRSPTARIDETRPLVPHAPPGAVDKSATAGVTSTESVAATAVAATHSRTRRRGCRSVPSAATLPPCGTRTGPTSSGLAMTLDRTTLIRGSGRSAPTRGLSLAVPRVHEVDRPHRDRSPPGLVVPVGVLRVLLVTRSGQIRRPFGSKVQGPRCPNHAFAKYLRLLDDGHAVCCLLHSNLPGGRAARNDRTASTAYGDVPLSRPDTTAAIDSSADACLQRYQRESREGRLGSNGLTPTRELT